jgi:prepilin peptidase CpaA
MALLAYLTPVAGFAALMAIAAFEDCRRFVVPNAVVVGVVALWPLYLTTMPGLTLAHALAAVGCAMTVFLVGAALFSRGLVGGGDVKLLAAASLWAGPERTPALLLTTAVLGGVIALALLCWVRLRAPAAGPGAELATLPLPYGVAIAAAAVIVTIIPNLS